MFCGTRWIDPVAGKITFNLQSRDRLRELPRRIIIGQQESETVRHVLLKLFGYVLFYRPRLQVEIDLGRDALPFLPDLVELDYELRPKLWVECGECSLSKLHKLAVKLPETEFWVIKSSEKAARDLHASMTEEEFRRDRYGIVGLDQKMFDEVCNLLQARNELFWVEGTFDPPRLQFDFNGLWFDAAFTVLRY
jgi:uncharacterized protein YaeQ